jgi:hypothetical protein
VLSFLSSQLEAKARALVYVRQDPKVKSRLPNRSRDWKITFQYLPLLHHCSYIYLTKTPNIITKSSQTSQQHSTASPDYPSLSPTKPSTLTLPRIHLTIHLTPTSIQKCKLLFNLDHVHPNPCYFPPQSTHPPNHNSHQTLTGLRTQHHQSKASSRAATPTTRRQASAAPSRASTRARNSATSRPSTEFWTGTLPCRGTSWS